MVYTRFTCQIMPERTQILFQSVIPRVGCYLTRLTSQTMSEPFMKNFTGQNSESDGIHPITCRIMSEQTQILFHRVIPRVGCYLTRLTPQTISEPFGKFLGGPNHPESVAAMFGRIAFARMV